MLCLCHHSSALLRFWFQTNLGRKNSASYLEIQEEKTFSYQGHELVTLYVQFLCSDWSKFDRWVHAEIYAASWNLFTLTAEADRVLCQLVMFLTVFFHWMYKMKRSCYQESSVFFMASLFIGFLVERCVACQSRKSDSGWHRFRFSPCLMRKRVQKSPAILALLHSFQELQLEW